MNWDAHDRPAPVRAAVVGAAIVLSAAGWAARPARGDALPAPPNDQAPSRNGAGIGVQIHINRTAALDDDFAIVAPPGNTTVLTVANISWFPPPGDPELVETVHLEGGGSGHLVFATGGEPGEAETIAIELTGDGSPVSVRVLARQPSSTIGGSSLEVRSNGPDGPLIRSQPLTLLERPAIYFQGSFQDRLPVNPDGSFDDNPQCGFVRRLDGEYPFDAQIRLGEPFQLRSLCTYEPVVVTRIVAEKPVGASFSAGDSVIGRSLRLEPGARFLGDPPGTEFITPFALDLGDGLAIFIPDGVPPRGRGESTGAGLPEYAQPADPFFVFIGNIAATTAHFDARVAALQENTDAYPAPPLPCPNNPDPQEGPPIGPETRLSWLEYFDGGIKQIMQGGMTGAGLYTGKILGTVSPPAVGSPLLHWFATQSEYDIGLVFFAYDADCLVGRVAGIVRPRAPACPCGDFNGDGIVSLLDFQTFATCFGLPAPSTMCPAPAFACADLDADGAITLADFSTFAAIFGTSPGTSSPPGCSSHE